MGLQQTFGLERGFDWPRIASDEGEVTATQSRKLTASKGFLANALPFLRVLDVLAREALHILELCFGDYCGSGRDEVGLTGASGFGVLGKRGEKVLLRDDLGIGFAEAIDLLAEDLAPAIPDLVRRGAGDEDAHDAVRHLAIVLVEVTAGTTRAVEVLHRLGDLARDLDDANLFEALTEHGGVGAITLVAPVGQDLVRIHAAADQGEFITVAKTWVELVLAREGVLLAIGRGRDHTDAGPGPAIGIAVHGVHDLPLGVVERSFQDLELELATCGLDPTQRATEQVSLEVARGGHDLNEGEIEL